ncbi:ABC transporter permease [Streptomyces sp. NPDC005776]|uniref:ABC transporter permease n=1 Tax=Streptomyces sp. NPDC005776 TaxID=3154676 RepID=UPI0033E1415A
MPHRAPSRPYEKWVARAREVLREDGRTDPLRLLIDGPHNFPDFLRYFAELYAVEPRAQKRRIAELLDLVGLSGRERERVEGYSRRMRQRLHIARGLLHRPDVLVLDEPSIGVDPYGTLGAVLLSPQNRAPLRFGRALSYVLNGLAISVFTLAAACLLPGLRIPVGALPGPAAVLLAVAAGCSALGLALGALGLRFRDVVLISNVASSGLLLLTGANVPRENLPQWMRAVGDVLPMTHAAEAARKLSAGAGLGGRAIAAELAAGAGYVLLAVVLLTVFERGSRRRATLDVM